VLYCEHCRTEWGVSDVAVQLYGMRLVEAEREGRIILLYHTIALVVVAIETYLITALMPMKRHEQSTINGTITFGYIIALVFGLWFGYFGHDFVFHGLFICGQSLVFFAGLLLAKALWPWRKEYRARGSAYAQTAGGIDLERVAFFTMACAALGSALFGAVTASYWGRGQWTADVHAGMHDRTLRGGSKSNYGYNLRVWTRNSAPPDYASPDVGFRCVRK